MKAPASMHAHYHPGRYESERWLEVGGGNLRAAGALRPHRGPSASLTGRGEYCCPRPVLQSRAGAGTGRPLEALYPSQQEGDGRRGLS